MRSIAHTSLAALALAMPACAGSEPQAEATMTAADTPLACTLTPGELQALREELLPGLVARATDVTDLENGLRLSFASQSGLLSDLARMMEQERACCRFLRFELTAEPDDGVIRLDVTGPPGTRELLRSL